MELWVLIVLYVLEFLCDGVFVWLFLRSYRFGGVLLNSMEPCVTRFAEGDESESLWALFVWLRRLCMVHTVVFAAFAVFWALFLVFQIVAYVFWQPILFAAVTLLVYGLFLRRMEWIWASHSLPVEATEMAVEENPCLVMRQRIKVTPLKPTTEDEALIRIEVSFEDVD